MKDIFKTETQKAMDLEIARLIRQLEDTSTVDPAYAEILNHLRSLCEARERKDPGGIDMNTVIAITANLVGLVLVLNFEKTGIVTSKAFGLLFRGRN